MMKTLSNKNKSKILKRLAAVALCIAVILPCMTVFSSCALTKDTRDVTYVKIKNDGKEIHVKAPVNDKSSKDVYLFALDFSQSKNDIADLEPLTKAKLSGDKAKAKFKITGNVAQTLCKGYVFARYNENNDSYTAISDVYYVTDPMTVHKKPKVKETDFSGHFKGAIGSPSELTSLNADSTCITVDLSEFLDSVGGDKNYSYIWNGITYYSPIEKINELDRKIVSYTQQGIEVFLEIVQSKSYEELHKDIRDIAFPSVSGADYYALNMTSRSGSSRICAFFDFIADRYSGHDYGSIKGLIIGNKVNDIYSNYANSLDVEQGILNYIKAVRGAYNILLSHNPSGKVYISLGNNWNVAKTGGITAREMLSAFNSLANTGGDFFWQVSVEANASDKSNSAIWEDDMANKDTPSFLSPENIELLSMLLNTSPYMCRNMKRHILVNRLEIGGADEEKQAASYAYAYYKCFATEKVDAVIYGKMHDASEETIKNGLYKAQLGIIAPEEKQIADVFRNIDCAGSESVSFVSSVIGKKWDKLYEEYAKDIKASRFKNCDVESKGSGENVKTVTDFTEGENLGFKPVSANYMEFKYSEAHKKPALFVDASGNKPFDMSGFSTFTMPKKELKKAGFLGFNALLSSRDVEAKVMIVVSGYNSKGERLVYNYETSAQTNVWENFYVDIREAVSKIKGDNVSVTFLSCAQSSENEMTGIWLSEITTESPIRKVFPVWAIILIVVLIVVGALVGFGIWFHKNYTFVRE